MKKIKKYTLLLFIFSLLSVNLSLFAQRASVRATVSQAEIMIGEQDTLHVEVIVPKGRSIIFPVYPDTLITGIEVLDMLPLDTIISHDVMTLRQKYLITSFDSTLYHIPYIPIIDGSDTVKSNSFGLKVTSVMLSEPVLEYLDRMKTGQTDSIDFNALELHDIKPNIEPPFVWQDYASYLWVVLLIILFIALIALGLYFALRKKKKGYFFTPQVVLPPHIVAIRELDKIKKEKLWQQGLEKKYYTELTDVVREYIEKRFSLNAFEKTSDEILTSMKSNIEAESSFESLKQILQLADLVKFAKYKPLPNENDLSLVNAYLFVNQTKIEPKEEPVEATLSQSDDEGIVKTESENPEENKANS